MAAGSGLPSFISVALALAHESQDSGSEDSMSESWSDILRYTFQNPREQRRMRILSRLRGLKIRQPNATCARPSRIFPGLRRRSSTDRSRKLPQSLIN